MSAAEENKEHLKVDSNPAELKPKKGVVAAVFGGDVLTGEWMQRHLGLIGFIAILLILDIALQYKFEDYHKLIIKREKELNEQRTIYNEQMSALETKRRQSEVAKDIENMGLKELSKPPIVLEYIDSTKQK
ncbi:MAG: hypothetical protein RLY35_462 [Bacteroidota bacterium]|jgi:hypothetical protein